MLFMEKLNGCRNLIEIFTGKKMIKKMEKKISTKNAIFFLLLISFVVYSYIHPEHPFPGLDFHDSYHQHPKEAKSVIFCGGSLWF